MWKDVLSLGGVFYDNCTSHSRRCHDASHCFDASTGPRTRRPVAQSCRSRLRRLLLNRVRGATIRGFSQEKENGETFYEAGLTVSGRSKEVLMDVNGSVIEVERLICNSSVFFTSRTSPDLITPSK
jgi:hypothetical protein